MTIASAGSLVGMFDHYDTPAEVKVRLGSMFCTEDMNGGDIVRLPDDECVVKAKSEIQLTMVFTSLFLFFASGSITVRAGIHGCIEHDCVLAATGPVRGAPSIMRLCLLLTIL